MDFQLGATGTRDGSFPSIHLRDHLAIAARGSARCDHNGGLDLIRLADAP